MGNKRRWKDLTRGQKIAVGAVGAAQVTLTAAAYRDLLRRPAERVNGTKLAWGLALLANWVGPIACFLDGRKDRRPAASMLSSPLPGARGAAAAGSPGEGVSARATP